MSAILVRPVISFGGLLTCIAARENPSPGASSSVPKYTSTSHLSVSMMASDMDKMEASPRRAVEVDHAVSGAMLVSVPSFPFGDESVATVPVVSSNRQYPTSSVSSPTSVEFIDS